MSTKEDLDSHLAIIEQTTANPVHLSDVSEKAPGFNATANETTDTPQYPGRVRLVFLVFGLVLSSFLIGLDNTIISSAIPKITDQFHALEDVGWYGSALLLTTCAFQLAWGKLYTFYPVKLTYLTALFVFEIGSLICAVAPTSVALIIGRAIAGVGTGGASAGGYLLVALSVPERQRPTLVGLIGSMYGVSTVAGPLLGGLFTDSPRLTWRWCFYINLPLGAIAAVIILLCGPSSRVRGDPGRPASLLGQLRLMDLPGTLALVPGVICFLLALQWGGAKYAWTNGRIIALLVVAVCLFVAFIAIQIRSGERATVPPRIFANRNIWGSAIFGACLTACFFVMVYYVRLPPLPRNNAYEAD
jgi:MFS family permease